LTALSAEGEMAIEDALQRLLPHPKAGDTGAAAGGMEDALQR
jgi:hypothetical protein